MLYNYETLAGLGALSLGAVYFSLQSASYLSKKTALSVKGGVRRGTDEHARARKEAQDLLRNTDSILFKILFPGQRLAASKYLQENLP